MKSLIETFILFLTEAKSGRGDSMVQVGGSFGRFPHPLLAMLIRETRGWLMEDCVSFSEGLKNQHDVKPRGVGFPMR